jgi:DNA-binding HxlR family transcriptional regulator
MQSPAPTTATEAIHCDIDFFPQMVNYQHRSFGASGCKMQRKSFSDMQCPIARGLEHVGEWWSILILRDAFRGLSRFDEFSESLGIAPNMLTRRLTALVEADLMQRRRYNEHPPRDEYVLTERGRDFRPAMLAMLAFGNRHFPPDDRTVQIVNTATGQTVDPLLVDPANGKPVDGPGYRVVTTMLRRKAA